MVSGSGEGRADPAAKSPRSRAPRPATARLGHKAIVTDLGPALPVSGPSPLFMGLRRP